MREFLIRTAAGHDWPAFNAGQMEHVLLPPDWTPDPSVDGDFAARSGDATVAYSGEEVGWHVTVTGDPSDLGSWIDEVTRRIGEASGESCEWLEL